MKYKERRTDHLYDAQQVGNNQIIVKKLTYKGPSTPELLTIEEFIERFDESYVQSS